HHKHEIDDYITSRNLIKSLEGNIKDTNTLTKEELLLLIHDIEALEDETLQQNIVRNNLDNQINDLKNSKSWKITSKLRRQ
ncbi:MAG: glycosyl transferase, partial [Methanobrevibacter sp.]|nr:glycosyl transferase [Methanobrevibacter sp.]